VNVTINQANADRIEAAISGEMDADNCAEVGATLLEAGPTAATMLLDTSQLGFLDSSGISELLRIHDAMESAGGTLRLIDPTDNVRRVLEITGLLETFGLD
jgi:anti-sigma B factor antagonist